MTKNPVKLPKTTVSVGRGEVRVERDRTELRTLKEVTNQEEKLGSTERNL